MGYTQQIECTSMAMATTTLEQAKNEIKAVLKRYRLSWDEVAPDRDEQIWKELRPTVKKIRKELFRKAYPSL